MKNRIALILALAALATDLKAQTGGPGQPEFMQFKPATATDLVNPATGSFSYNIPLFDVGGYPVNLSYQAGITMEDVASIVGLGWNINIGAVTHTMRGLPDDFNGDKVIRTIYMKPNITYGGNVDVGMEVAGFGLGAGLDMGFGVFYNNYNGYGIEQSIGLSLSMHKQGNPGTASLGLGMKANSQSGVDIYAQPSVSLQLSNSSGMAASGSLSGMVSVNSREGEKQSINASMSVSVSCPESKTVKDAATGKESQVKDNSISESIANASASYSFSKTPEIPRVTYPFHTEAYNGSFKVGAEVFFMHPHGEVKGYYTKQSLATNVIATPAYGYLYEDQAPNYSDDVLLDYAREKDQPYIKDASINIGIPSYTNDIYSVNAQGISGSFQLDRGDVGVIFDNHVVTSGTNLNIGVEVGVGNATHVGADLSSTSTFASSGKWNSFVTPNVSFKPSKPDYLYQSAYFKNASDVAIDDNQFFKKLGGDYAVKVLLDDPGSSSDQVYTTSSLLDDHGNSALIAQAGSTGEYFKDIRDSRTINIQYKTAALAAKCGLNRTINLYKINEFGCNNIVANQSRDSAYRKGHHISEMTSTNTDGMRYVFGLPTYNVQQKEVSFTLAEGRTPTLSGGATDGLLAYTSADQNWGSNGKDGFYESTELPPYVTSHLLTAVLSPDYIDVDNNGPSLSDVGNYVKINYSFAGNYRWRSPYGANSATFNRAFLSDQTDNKANYVYGVKELYYTHSVESKTEIAEFYYDKSGRQDGLGVTGENGGKNLSQRLYKLDSIKVYSINERVLKGADASPIRIIYFEYNYELCPGIHNTSNTSSAANTNGKLTLKKVSFASGKSMRELLSPYRFTYGIMPNGDSINPPYDGRATNRFGNLQHNSGASDVDISKPLSNVDFPYPSQDEAEMTKNAYAWNLTKITLPSRGSISVEYEPNRYAYTQDKRCMEMFQLYGDASTNNLVSNTLRVFFELRTSINPLDPTAHDQLLYKYFDNNLEQYYYYKALVDLRPIPNTKEWISGYCKIADVILLDATHAAIDLRPVCKGDYTLCSQPPHLANPIAKMAWQFMRMNRADLCYDASPDVAGMGLEAFIKSNPLGQLGKQIDAFVNGFSYYAQTASLAATFDPAKSFFRLYSPGKNKIIGGSRVKRIVSDDNWKEETDGASASKTYTTDYEYTAVEKNPVTGLPDTVSTGVMEYEPFNGQDENPMRQPMFIDQQIKMAPDNRLFVETPFNENLFPGSNLNYSKVTVTSNKTDLNVPGTGHQEIECYTAKDYPVYTDNTILGSNHEKKTGFLASFVSSMFGMAQSHDYVTLSQGFAITLNDMHGKQKATRNYNSHGALISSEQYEYSLGKTLSLIDHQDHIYSSDKLGVSTSAICDSRFTEHTTDVTGVNMNLDLAFVPLIPLTLFVPLPNMSHEESAISTVSLNKITTKKGIMIRKTVTENGAAVSTDNLLFDDKTGFVVLTKTTNEFEDTLFKFHYAADWLYSGLGAGFLSSDLEFKPSATTPANYFTVAPAVYPALAIGDEIVVPTTGLRCWVMNKIPPNQVQVESDVVGTVVLISGVTCRVIRSGRRNQLMQEAGSVVSLKNPMGSSRVDFALTNWDAKVINASMQEFADRRIKYCECDHVVVPPAGDCSATEPTPEPVKGDTIHPGPVIVTAKYFLGGCSDSSLADPSGPWLPGSIIRWRVAVANVGNVNALNCQVTDHLPADLTYVGGDKYFYGKPVSSTPNAPIHCAVQSAIPAQIVAMTALPTVGSSTPVWKFQQLPVQSNSTTNYLVIDFDVKVASNAPPRKYCNFFTFTYSGVPPATPITVTSNSAQVVIGPSSSNGSGTTALANNPYLTGERGNWYPSTTWSYLTDRKRSLNVVVPTTNIRADGVFADYKNFWSIPVRGSTWYRSTLGWQWVETVTKKDVNGLTLETSDVLGRHNALMTGYRNKLVVAEAGNARINEILFDGFEDWKYVPIGGYCDTVQPCVPKIANWEGIFNPDPTESHTGAYSGKLVGGGQTITIDVAPVSSVVEVIETPVNGRPQEVSQWDGPIVATSTEGDVSHHEVPNCVGVFKPTVDKKYVFSAWVRDDNNSLATNFPDPKVRIGSSTFTTVGNIIDGWQNIYGEFDIPANATSLSLQFLPGAGNTWYDDIRMFPYDAKMVTHDYDGNTQKLTFTSDENNYFTKYNYDASDNLESINKETEKGIQTVKEARSAIKKQP